MRFASEPTSSGRVVAVTGTNTASFAMLVPKAAAKGLLGFAVERIDEAKGERYFMAGFKVYRSVIPTPVPRQQVSTFDHPVQSFVWDDFTMAANHEYTYLFHPLKGKAKNLDRSSEPIRITVRTEALRGKTHDVFFNRGVASSQAYERRFGTTPIDQLVPPAKKAAALAWLTRDLGPSLLRFVERCEAGDRLHGCFYEFRWEPAARALADAVARGVDVRLIVDGKVNEHTDKKGVFHESFPREENLRMLAAVGIDLGRVILREGRPTAIAHNKFLVRSTGAGPREVWTGSTNLSRGGVAGQTNVGHWVRQPPTARAFLDYWELLATDPGSRRGMSSAEARSANAAFEQAVEAISPVPDDLRTVPAGTTVVFSPRQGAALLDHYAELLDSAHRSGSITLAFGVSQVFKGLLGDNTHQSALLFLLLEKADRPRKNSTTPFVAINASNNVYKAWGSFLRDPVYQWARETSAGALGLNQHVSFVHSKFMLVDPLSADPIIVTGSANFSEPSVNTNDENMLVIRGDLRAADIYFTEFNRLFNHYYFRSVTEDLARRDDDPAKDDSLFLAETDAWQAKYEPGSFKQKRLDVFAGLEGLTTP